MDKFKGLLASRKFWASAIGTALIVVKATYPDFPLDEEQLTNVVYLLVAYIVGTGIESAASKPTG